MSHDKQTFAQKTEETKHTKTQSLHIKAPRLYLFFHINASKVLKQITACTKKPVLTYYREAL